jgi:peptidoglycan/LPS O-acetylase OafA/YrhL
LDGLRGIALLMVVAFHSALYGGLGRVCLFHELPAGLPDCRARVAQVVWSVATQGKFGVELFFVLSAFLMTTVLIETRNAATYFSSFYARRFLRIFPLYYVVLAVLLWLHPWGDSSAVHSGWYWSYLSNFLLAGGWDRAPVELHHFWSLAIEEQFYLAWPLVIFFLRRNHLATLTGIMVCGSLLARIAFYRQGEPQAAMFVTFARLDPIAVGAYVALRAQAPVGFHRFARCAAPAAIVLFTLIVGMILWRGVDLPDAVTGTVGYSLYALFFGSLLVLSLTAGASSSWQKLLTRPIFLSMGKYSYALYVLHQPILLFIGARAGLGRWGEPRERTAPLAFISVPALAFVTTYLLARISWIGLEAPFLRLKRFFPRGEPLGTEPSVASRTVS